MGRLHVTVLRPPPREVSCLCFPSQCVFLNPTTSLLPAAHGARGAIKLPLGHCLCAGVSLLSSPSDWFLHLQFCLPPTINHTLQPHIQTTTSLRKHFQRLPIASTTRDTYMVYSWPPALLPTRSQYPIHISSACKAAPVPWAPPPCPPLCWKNPSSTFHPETSYLCILQDFAQFTWFQKPILRPPNPDSDAYLPFSPLLEHLTQHWWHWIRVFLYLSPQLRLCDCWRQKQHTFSLPVVSGTINGCCTEVIQEGVQY